MAPTKARVTESGIPLGDVRISGGPGRYEFLIEGLAVRGGGDSNAALEFKLDYGASDDARVHIRVTAVRQIAEWLCPPYPGPAGGPSEPHDLTWADAWEFRGFCPGEGVPVRGIYSPRSRKGVIFLWEAHYSVYGCRGARQDLHTFFAGADNAESLFALERAMGHMARGAQIGHRHVDCEECWEMFRRLRQSCELP